MTETEGDNIEGKKVGWWKMEL
jgi:hypothetical protein